MNTRIGHLLLCATLILPFAALPFANAAAPAPEDVGVSGECYDSDGSGGEAEVEVENGAAYTPGVPDGAVAAVLAFTNDPKGIPAGNACTGPGDDHLEAHAFVDTGVAGVVGIEVCYDGTLNTYSYDACDDEGEGDSG